MEYRTILTDAGLAAVAAAAKAGEQVQITHLAMGDGGGTEYAPDSAQTSLKNERWRGAVASYTRDENRFTVTAHMPAETEAFVVRELALFLSDGTCFAVANAPSVPHQPPVDGVGTEFETIMPFAVENADSVTVAVDPTGGIPWSMVGQPNGVAGLDETGKVPESQLPELDFDPSGSAAAVQRQLEAHTASKNNPHGVTAAQVGAFTKAQTLTAGTAALVGLGADAVPDAVFAKFKSLIDAANANADTKSKMVFGSYVGTGTWGSSAPNVLSFDFPVKALFIVQVKFPVSGPSYRYDTISCVFIPGTEADKYSTEYMVSSQNRSISSVNWSNGNKTVSWYSSTNYDWQLNTPSATFHYIAFG